MMMMFESDESNGANILFRNCDERRAFEFEGTNDDDGIFTMGI